MSRASVRLRVESVHDAQLRESFGADLDEMEGMVHGALALFEGLDDEALEAVDVNALLAKLVADYGVLGSDVSITGTALEGVNAKPRALRRCLTNLVDNALKFGKRATILVEMKVALASHHSSVTSHFFLAGAFRAGRKFRDRLDC